MLTKPARQLTEDDLRGLVVAQATEDDWLDFKRDMYGEKHKDVAGMMRDISGLANRKGGTILIGVDADKQGVATSVDGIDGAGHVERIVSSASANISPRLRGLDVFAIALSNGHSVIAVNVPQSVTGPHMVTYDGENRFWRRHGQQVVKMTVDEIEESFVNRLLGYSRIEEAFQRQLAEHDQEERQTRGAGAAVLVRDDRWLVLQAAPVFMHEEIIDIADERVQTLLAHSPMHPRSINRLVEGWPRPSLHGLLIEERDESGSLILSLELHRNGYLEFRGRHFDGHAGGARDEIPANVVLFSIHSFVHLFERLLEHVSVSMPALIGLTLVHVDTCALAFPMRANSGTIRRWHRTHLQAQVYSEDLHRDADSVVRQLNDRLWNAFGYQRCFTLKDDGDVITG